LFFAELQSNTTLNAALSQAYNITGPFQLQDFFNLALFFPNSIIIEKGISFYLIVVSIDKLRCTLQI